MELDAIEVQLLANHHLSQASHLTHLSEICLGELRKAEHYIKLLAQLTSTEGGKS